MNRAAPNQAGFPRRRPRAAGLTERMAGRERVRFASAAPAGESWCLLPVARPPRAGWWPIARSSVEPVAARSSPRPRGAPAPGGPVGRRARSFPARAPEPGPRRAAHACGRTRGRDSTCPRSVPVRSASMSALVAESSGLIQLPERWLMPPKPLRPAPRSSLSNRVSSWSSAVCAVAIAWAPTRRATRVR